MTNNKVFIGKIIITKTYEELLMKINFYHCMKSSDINTSRKLPLEINCYYNNKLAEYEFIENQYDTIFYAAHFLNTSYMNIPIVQNQYNNLLKVIRREKLLTNLLEMK